MSFDSHACLRGVWDTETHNMSHIFDTSWPWCTSDSEHWWGSWMMHWWCVECVCLCVQWSWWWAWWNSALMLHKMLHIKEVLVASTPCKVTLWWYHRFIPAARLNTSLTPDHVGTYIMLYYDKHHKTMSGSTQVAVWAFALDYYITESVLSSLSRESFLENIWKLLSLGRT